MFGSPFPVTMSNGVQTVVVNDFFSFWQHKQRGYTTGGTPDQSPTEPGEPVSTLRIVDNGDGTLTAES